MGVFWVVLSEAACIVNINNKKYFRESMYHVHDNASLHASYSLTIIASGDITKVGDPVRSFHVKNYLNVKSSVALKPPDVWNFQSVQVCSW